MNREPGTMGHIHSYPMEDNFLVHSSQEGKLYILNATGLYMLERVSAGHPVFEVAREVSRRYGIPIEAATDDIKKAIAEWQRIGLLPCKEASSCLNEVSRGLPPGRSKRINVIRYYRLHDLRFSIHYDREAMERQCHPRLSAIATSSVDDLDTEFEILSDDAIWTVVRDRCEVFRTASASEARVELMIGILKSRYPDLQILSLIHAGVTAHGDKVVLLPAGTERGKSTLTAALIHAGFSYLSDDMAPIDKPTGRVFPFPLGLSLRPGSWQMVGRMFPELLDWPALTAPYETLKVMRLPQARTVSTPLEASALVFPAYKRGRRTKLRGLSLTETMVQLSQAGFWVPLQGGHIPRFLDWLRPLQCYGLDYSSLEAAVDLIGGL